jgi:AcrR family transcriptional regulator
VPVRTDSADPRARRLRAAIKDAALELAARQPVQTLTVQQVAAAAGVSRQGFYRHFADTAAPVVAALTDAFADAFGRAVPDPAQPHVPGSLHALALVLVAHRDVLRNVSRSPSWLAFEDECRALLRGPCHEFAARVLERRNGSEPTDGEVRTLTRFMVGGALELVVDWVRDDVPPTSAESLAASLWSEVQLTFPR